MMKTLDRQRKSSYPYYMSNNILRRRFRYSYENYTLWLIGINVVVFFLLQIVSYRTSLTYGALSVWGVNRGRVWQFVTYMFMHYDFFHLLFNMLGLFIFGKIVENRMGSREFLLFYLVVGIGSGIITYIIYRFTGTMNPVVGASGAIYGLLFAFAVYFPHSQIYLWGILPVRAPILVLIYAVISLFSQISGRQSGVAHLTHLFGFVVAYLYFIIRLRISPIDEFQRGGGGTFRF